MHLGGSYRDLSARGMMYIENTLASLWHPIYHRFMATLTDAGATLRLWPTSQLQFDETRRALDAFPPNQQWKIW